MTYLTINGLYGIKASVLAHSISPAGIHFYTFEIEYPRMVLAELNTHGMLVRNSASSRAIPFKRMVEQLTARPVRFGQANPGMQDKGEDYDAKIEGYTAEDWWDLAKKSAVRFATELFDAGYHKQVYNRITEPFQMMKTVISGTEWNNFMWLRDHGAADPTIAELARVIKEAIKESTPRQLRPGEWHLPYVYMGKMDNSMYYWIYESELPDITERVYLSLDNAIKVSGARCAAVSFRNEDYGLTKCLEVYDKLVGDERKHASAFQHQATPMHAAQAGRLEHDINIPFDPFTWEPGVSHVDRDGQLWSAQLRGWVMNRKLIAGENVPG